MFSITPIKNVADNENANQHAISFKGEPAQAWVYDFLKDTFQPIRNETIGRLFTQEFLTSYNANDLEKQEGGAAWTKANDLCKKELRSRTGRVVSDISISVRKEGENYNCYERKYKY